MDDLIEVIVEVPKGSRNKYELDHETRVIRLDRRLFSATTYPGDYGFIHGTWGEDGDPLDALVVVEDPTFPGCWITARVVGVFWMEDEKGPDAKIIAVPHNDPLRGDVGDIEDLPASLRAEIEHFFQVYKTLEPDKKTTTGGFEGREAAMKEVRDARERAAQTGRSG
jgi:inorganic pyrophosphatase